MVTADPCRTPTFTLFADPDWFFFATGGARCAPRRATARRSRASTSQSFAWNHGDIQDEIASTWVGLRRPGRRAPGRLGRLDRPHRRASDDVDAARPARRLHPRWPRRRRAARGLGRAADAARSPRDLLRLGAVYKQLNASFGAFAMDTLKASTKALASGSTADDSTTRDREPHPDADLRAGHARRHHQGRAFGRGLRRAGAERAAGEELDRAGERPARCSSLPRLLGGRERRAALRGRPPPTTACGASAPLRT